MDDKLNCKICGREFKSYKGLGSHVSKTHKLSSKEYYDRYFKKENEGLCPECGKETKFDNVNKCYRKYCSLKCSSNSKEIKEKKKETNLEKYGVEHPSQNEEVKEKMKQTMIDRYGVENYLQTEEHKLKMRNGHAAYMNSFIKNPSKPQVELFNLIKEIYSDAELNYQILNYSVDIVIPELKICFEYDGSYWHQGKEESDKKRQKEIELLGWRFIRYMDRIPLIEELTNDINNIIHI